MLECGEGKQPGAVDVLYLPLQVFSYWRFQQHAPTEPLIRSHVAVMMIIKVIIAILLTNIIS